MAVGTALVVEDDRDIRMLLCDILSLGGVVPAPAVDGADALRQIRAGLRPCVILLDRIMPGMDGKRFLEERKRDPAIASLPVVVMSAAEPDDLASFDADGWLAKPFTAERVLEVVGPWCRLNLRSG